MTKGQFYIIEILMRLHKLQAEWQGSDKNLFDFFHIEVESDFEGELEDALVDVDFYNKIKPYCNENLLSWLKQVKVDIDAIIVEYMEDNRGCYYPSVELSFYQDEGLRTKRKIRLVEAIREHIERYELVHGKPQQEQATPEPQQSILPKELNTREAETYFSEAIDRGWIERRGNNLRWTGFGKKPCVAQLAYLCSRVYGYVYNNDRNEGERVPYKALEKLFSVERLDRSLKQVYEAKSPQHWRQDIDSLFD